MSSHTIHYAILQLCDLSLNCLADQNNDQILHYLIAAYAYVWLVACVLIIYLTTHCFATNLYVENFLMYK